MAYSQNNLFAMPMNNISGSMQHFGYRSADPIATVVAAGYIANAAEMGMALYDIVWVTETAGGTTSICRVTVINATTGAATLSAGLAIT